MAPPISHHTSLQHAWAWRHTFKLIFRIALKDAPAMPQPKLKIPEPDNGWARFYCIIAAIMYFGCGSFGLVIAVMIRNDKFGAVNHVLQQYTKYPELLHVSAEQFEDIKLLLHWINFLAFAHIALLPFFFVGNTYAILTSSAIKRWRESPIGGNAAAMHSQRAKSSNRTAVLVLAIFYIMTICLAGCLLALLVYAAPYYNLYTFPGPNSQEVGMKPLLNFICGLTALMLFSVFLLTPAVYVCTKGLFMWHIGWKRNILDPLAEGDEFYALRV